MLLEASYYWPHMQDDNELYVSTCRVCQQDKVKNRTSDGLLEPLPIAEKPWDSISMDFITSCQIPMGSVLVWLLLIGSKSM